MQARQYFPWNIIILLIRCNVAQVVSDYFNEMDEEMKEQQSNIRAELVSMEKAIPNEVLDLPLYYY